MMGTKIFQPSMVSIESSIFQQTRLKKSYQIVSYSCTAIDVLWLRSSLELCYHYFGDYFITCSPKRSIREQNGLPPLLTSFMQFL